MEHLNTKEISYEFYAYSWHIDEESQDETFIRVYGFDDQLKNICVSINGFQPFVWVELPVHINWSIYDNKERLYLYFKQTFPGVKCTLKFLKKLYGANLRKDGGQYTFKTFPFLVCSCSSFKELKFTLISKLRKPQRILGLGNLKFRVHGQDACPRLQLTSKYNLPTAGWIKFKGIEVLDDEYKFTSCDREFMVNLKLCKMYNCKPHDLISRSSKTTVPKPLVLSFDLEVNSEDGITMPKATRPGDVVFQISCVFSRLGSQTYQKYLLSLGDPSENIVGATILRYSTEQKLLMGFRDLVNEKNPNVVIGYNIFNFDIPYLIDRANHKSIYPLWAQQGFAKNRPGIQREIKWSSSAYKNQEFKFLECEGRLYIDLLPVVQRDFKLNDYKLKTVSTHFIGETKNDLDPKSIFRCYREGIKMQLLIVVKLNQNIYKLVVGLENMVNSDFKNVEGVFWVEDTQNLFIGEINIKYQDLKNMITCQANGLEVKFINKNGSLKVDNLPQKYMSICGKYCIQDSILVSKLMEKLNTWYSLSEMAVICNVPMITLFTKGQQIKVYSNLYKFCLEKMIVPESGYPVSENERYVGAHVFVPQPGLYQNVVPFDFSALYPSLIIAYNIDYSSCAFDPTIPDELCHVMEWEDHISCKHDPKVIEKNRLTELIEKLSSDKRCNKALLADVRKQRSEITKSLNKNIMCEHRRYRFLKVTTKNPEFKGVLPTIVQSLLNARKETRKEMGRLKTQLNTETSEEKRKEIEITINILNQRQLAYKVSANSMYGITGVKAGMLPFMPAAMSITYKGREGVKKVSEILQTQYNGELVYGDTDCLIPTTPLLINCKGSLFYTTIDNISKGDWKPINATKEISTPKDGYKVWSDQGFTDIINVVRCKPTFDSLTRITTNSGTVVCSNKHSLITDTLHPVTPSQVKIGDDLCVCLLPFLEDNRLKDIPDVIAFYWGLLTRNGKFPNIVLQAPLSVRRSFFQGYSMCGTTFKDQCQAAQVYFLMSSLGYKVRLEVKSNTYKLIPTTTLLNPGTIVKKTTYLTPVDYIYDIQTRNHHFAAGIGQIVVHNSNYVAFQKQNFSIPELWDYAIKVADEISGLFPPPMKLEFEEAIYTKFLILTKKRYLYQTALRDGTIKPEIGKKGVVLNRRDNSAFIRSSYENIVKIIFENTEDKVKLRTKLIESIVNDVNMMFNHQYPIENFVITKSTGDYGNLQPHYFLNDKGIQRAMIGQYNVPFLTEEIKENEGIQTPEQETNWYLDKLPAHIQLLEKIKRRGHTRNEGSRLEYVVIDTNNLKDKLSAKYETVGYYTKNKDILNLDYLYYLNRLINPIDQVLEVTVNLNDFVKKMYKDRFLMKKVTLQLKDLFSPIYIIEKEWLYLLKELNYYHLVCGTKEYCKSMVLPHHTLIFKTKYTPSKPTDMYSFLSLKYGPTTSLKTHFIFKDNMILLGDMSETRLISTIKRECDD